MKNIGKLIVVEGLDGSGKGTQIALLKEKLEAAGRNVIATAEPTQSAAGGLCLLFALFGKRQNNSA